MTDGNDWIGYKHYIVSNCYNFVYPLQVADAVFLHGDVVMSAQIRGFA
jgi:predicted phosphohydrolase